jgi:hypothetical protein
MEGRSPAQLYSLVFGAILLLAGIIGFFFSASFAAGEAVETNAYVLDILAVNAWHNIVHILTGLIGLLVVGSYAGARVYALGLGVVYLLVTVLGFAMEPAIFTLIPVNLEDNILHLLIGVAGVAAGLATPAQPAPTAAT